jgi:hypothetical protein
MILLTNKSFRLFRSFGVHLVPVNYYSPIPDLRDLLTRPSIWEQPSDLPGVDLNKAGQLSLMEHVLAAFQYECDYRRQQGDDPSEFYTQNDYFGYVSAVAMHSMVRHFRPKRIIEVGAGFSTRVISRAVSMNAEAGAPAELVVIDPYIDRILPDELPAPYESIASKVEDVPLERFTSLREGDLLSIDSSHAVRIGGDVAFLYLEVLPRLAPGVLVHIHDIFLPFNYPMQWLQRRYFWNEQYLLHAFLIHNDASGCGDRCWRVPTD